MPDDEQESRLAVLVELVDKVTEPLHELSEKFEEFESGIWDVGRAFGSAFLGYELFEHLIEPAAEFQEAQVKLALATRASTEELAEMKKQAEDLSETFPSSIDAVTAAQTELYQTFRNFDQMREGTEIADKLATVMRIDVTESARILASAYENLEDRSKPVAEGFQEISDKLTLLNTRFPSGASGAARMARDFARLGASAKTYGININQIFALLGELNRLHVAGQMGAGMFAQQLIHLIGAVDEKGVNALAKYGLQVVHTTDGHLNLIKTLEVMSKMSPQALQKLGEHLPGQGQALSLLVDHIHDLTSAYGEFRDAAGATDDAVKKQTETYDNQMQRFQNSFKNLKELMGVMALPTFTTLIIDLTNLVKVVKDFGEENPKFAKALTEIALGAAAIVTAIGAVGFVSKLVGFLVEFSGAAKIATGVWSMLVNAVTLGSIVAEEGLTALGPAIALAFESNPIGWIITALVAIAGLSYEIYAHWEKILSLINDAKFAFDGLLRKMGLDPKELANLHRALSGFNPITLYGKGLQAEGHLIGEAASSVASAVPFSARDAASSIASTLHFSPQITIQAGIGADAHAIGQSVTGSLRSFKDELETIWGNMRHDNDRRSFGDFTRKRPD